MRRILALAVLLVASAAAQDVGCINKRSEKFCNKKVKKCSKGRVAKVCPAHCKPECGAAALPAPTTTATVCKDKLSQKKCDRLFDQGKCSKKGAKCAETCSFQGCRNTRTQGGSISRECGCEQCAHAARLSALPFVGALPYRAIHPAARAGRAERPHRSSPSSSLGARY